MCDLCSEIREVRESARAVLGYEEAKLEKMAFYLRQLRTNKMTPHSEEAKKIAMQARNIIRYLVNDWL